MANEAHSQPRRIEQARAELSRRLESRREEIEATVMLRIYAVEDPGDLDPTYAEGLRGAVRAAVDYGLGAIERGEQRSPPPPPALLAQARMAARVGVGLDTVLRRYFAGQALLADFVAEEAAKEGPSGAATVRQLMRSQATVFDRLLAALSEEHRREAAAVRLSREERRAERVQRLLAGEMLDSSDLDYDLAAHHLGLLARGEGADKALPELAAALDRRLLAVEGGEQTVWAWLGGRRAPDPESLRELSLPPSLTLALGEPNQGLAGWRLTHRQACAALPVALRSGDRLVRYADVALLATALHDDLLAESLRQIYIAPLEQEAHQSMDLIATLRAYFAAGRQASSAAAALGVSRRTVSNRLRAAEAVLHCSLRAATPGLEVALHIDALDPLPIGSHRVNHYR